MAKSNLDINKLKAKLSKIPSDKLSEIDDFIDFILTRSKKQPAKIVKLEGIWKGLGFEKIDDIEGKIRKIRRETAKTIFKRVQK